MSEILVFVQEVINEKPPIAAAQIRVIIKLLRATLDLIEHYFAKSNLRLLRHVLRVLIVEADNGVAYLALCLQHLDIV